MRISDWSSDVLLFRSERGAFREMIKVSGIGARTALAVLSGLSVGDLAQAITLQESGRLPRVPGLGRKTAERLLLEMRGKLGADIGATAPAVPDSQADILNALLVLGYSGKESQGERKVGRANVRTTVN